MSDLKAELTASLDQAEWSWLLPHVQRETVFLVALHLDLVEVGMAIANDHTKLVEHWLAEQLIAKPSSPQIADWNNHDHKRFNALIIQPYVLIQELVT